MRKHRNESWLYFEKAPLGFTVFPNSQEYDLSLMESADEVTSPRQSVEGGVGSSELIPA
jgi:hypothetical protein